MKITHKNNKLRIDYPEGTEGTLKTRVIDLRKVQDLTIEETKLSVRISGKYASVFHKRSCKDDEDFLNRCEEVIDLWIKM
jgi:hypothetical protein